MVMFKFYILSSPFQLYATRSVDKKTSNLVNPCLARCHESPKTQHMESNQKLDLRFWIEFLYKKDKPEYHHGEQLKQSTRDTEEWDRVFHPSLIESVTASSSGPGNKETQLVSCDVSMIHTRLCLHGIKCYRWACTICQEYIIWISRKAITSFNSSSNCITQSFDSLMWRTKTWFMLSTPQIFHLNETIESLQGVYQ